MRLQMSDTIIELSSICLFESTLLGDLIEWLGTSSLRAHARKEGRPMAVLIDDQVFLSSTSVGCRIEKYNSLIGLEP